MPLIRAAFVAYLLLLTVLLLIPDPNAATGIDELPGLLKDHLMHFLALTGLAVLAHAARWPLRTGVTVGLLVVYAVVVESLQSFTPERDVELCDFVENLLGVAAGTAVYWPFRARRPAS